MEGADPSCLLHLQPFGHPRTPGSEEDGGRTTSVCLQSSCDSSVLPARISPPLQSEPLTAHFLSSKKCKLMCAPGGSTQLSQIVPNCRCCIELEAQTFPIQPRAEHQWWDTSMAAPWPSTWPSGQHAELSLDSKAAETGVHICGGALGSLSSTVHV